MATYDLGDAVTIPTAVTDVNGVLTDATMSIVVTKPDGSTTSPTVNHPGVGSFNAVVTVDQLGVWFYKWTASGALVGVESGQFTVANPAPPAYASLPELKAQLGILDRNDDLLLSKALVTASRAVEKWCGNRQFYLATTATARVYVPVGNYELFIDDVGTLTGLVVEVGSGGVYSTLAANNYEVTPTTALVRGEPVTSLVDLNYSGVFWAGGVTPRVRVTAQWGWPQIPDEISQATLLTAARLFRRKGSPEGVAGFGDLGVVRVMRVDPDVQALIQDFKRFAVA